MTDVTFSTRQPYYVSLVVGRAVDELDVFNYDDGYSQTELFMDIAAANGENGNPKMDMRKLWDFDQFNFAHDIHLLWNNMNRDTGKLERCVLLCAH